MASYQILTDATADLTEELMAGLPYVEIVPMQVEMGNTEYKICWITSDEAKRFYASCPGQTAVQAIGYKEIKPYLDGVSSLENAVENLKRATRRYAKRQLSWFRRDERIHWFNVDEYDSFQQLLDEVSAVVKEVLYGTTEE